MWCGAHGVSVFSLLDGVIDQDSEQFSGNFPPLPGHRTMWNSISESSPNFDLQKHSINKECTFERKCAWLIIVPGSCVKTNHPCLLLNLTQTSISGPVYCAPSNTSGAAYGGEPHLQQIFLIFTKYFCILLPGVELRVGWPEVGEAKVGDLDIHGGVQKQVLRFQVSVDNASGKNGIL